MERCPYVLDKQLKVLKDFYSTTSMLVKIDETKVIIIKSKKTTYAIFLYDNKLEEVTSYKYLEVDLHHKINCGHIIVKGLWRVERLFWSRK
jgi:hypothetical protein